MEQVKAEPVAWMYVPAAARLNDPICLTAKGPPKGAKSVIPLYATPQPAAVDGLVEALQRCRNIVRLHNHRQNEKVEDVIGIVNQALALIERKPEDV